MCGLLLFFLQQFHYCLPLNSVLYPPLLHHFQSPLKKTDQIISTNGLASLIQQRDSSPFSYEDVCTVPTEKIIKLARAIGIHKLLVITDL